MSSTKRRTILASLLILITLLYVVLRLRVTTDISEFVPGGEDRAKAELSKSIVGSELSRTLLLNIVAADQATAVRASKALEAAIRANPALMDRLAFIQGGPPEGVDRALWELYEPRRFAFAATDEASAKQLVSDAGLEQAVRELRKRIESPLSTLITRVAPEDPLLAIPRLMEQLGASAGGLDVVDGRFVAESHVGVLMLGTRASAFDADAQHLVFDPVLEEFKRVNEQFKNQLVLESAALARFSMSAERTIQNDLQRISVLSVLGMLAVCITLFRSLHLVILPWLPIGCGMLAGTAACLALFGSIHGLTLAIGSSLIGVCIDYITHFYVHHLLGPKGSTPEQTMRRIWMGLLVGGSTTVSGFALLAGSSFPGLRQVAAFSSVGIAVALFSTRYLVPQLMPREPQAPALLRRLAERLEAALHWLHRQRWGAAGLPLLALVLSVIGLSRINWDGDMSKLTQFDAALRDEDARVRLRVAHFDQSRFIVALGKNDEEALAANDRLVPVLAEARAHGELQSAHGVAPLLKSAAEQSAVASVLRQAGLRERLSAQLEQADFNHELFEPFFASLEQPAIAPLQFSDLLNSPAAPLVRSFRITFADQVGFVTFLRGVTDADALNARVREVPGVTFVDQVALMKAASSQYNRRTAELLLFGLVAVFAILLARYRSLRVAFAALLPAVLSAGVTLFVLNLVQLPLNVLALTGLLMVLSMGVDYSVFMAESAGHTQHPAEGGELGATMLGVIVDWFTTVFGFGVLALSQYPAMRTIGVVSAVGITSALILAPSALAFAGLGGKRASPVPRNVTP